MIDRSYLPYQSAREHQDSGMQKWMGFFLSEHTTSLGEEKYRVSLTSDLNRTEKLLLLSQLYSQTKSSKSNSAWRSERNFFKRSIHQNT